MIVATMALIVHAKQRHSHVGSQRLRDGYGRVLVSSRVVELTQLMFLERSPHAMMTSRENVQLLVVATSRPTMMLLAKSARHRQLATCLYCISNCVPGSIGVRPTENVSR
mmetsp:Transcript_49137/g.73278  ORF Transcript_49137/g.73278 Transcript_49137/m.73278 type:complete len:110 (-) Transcript_49137:136-465(-)